ncbi:pantoate--beta-alanine ligase [Gorillibacterium massiliense]|uniref:pantoate--beta-alanine ligase n=1 Tax=Gorillibacterium massiliense TaxID=1280390 RepID=UPI0004B9BCFD|nr:pantoate--beta-alanine ligase [Gorillibacterium massiliense]
MEAILTIKDLRQAIQKRKADFNAAGKAGSVGLVPTMGFLHDGHASLLQRARQENDIVVLSVFVNPTQFGPKEDFSTYPRDTERDLQVALKAGVDFVFMPDVLEMYPRKSRSSITVSADVTSKLCGASRPGHFDGVGLIVSKLLHIVQPDRAYFGMKDAQQVAVIRTFVDDLNIPVDIVACPIIRDTDGLALSSRNVYLTKEEREQALVLSRVLALADSWLVEEQNDPNLLRKRLIREIKKMPLADIDYVEILSYPNLAKPEEWSSLDNEMIIALAVRFGKTRLIDNRLLPIPSVIPVNRKLAGSFK